MTAKLIFLILGIFFVLASFHFLYEFCTEDDDNSVAPFFLLFVIGGVLVILSIFCWEFSNEYNEIKCSEYEVETIITTSSKGQVDTTYIIQYKPK